MGRKSHNGRTNKADIVQSKACIVSAFFCIYTVANYNVGTSGFKKQDSFPFSRLKQLPKTFSIPKNHRFHNVQLQAQALFITFLTAKNERRYLEFLEELEFSRISITELHNSLDSVKIIRKKNHNFDLALRKRLFCVAKPTLLPCKTAAFGT